MDRRKWSLLVSSFLVFLVARSQGEIPDWEKIGPGGGGATFIPTFSYQSPENFLVRCDMTGSYLTKNGGASYRQINFANGASSYAYDPNDSAIIYLGSTMLNRSRDGGKTWQAIFPKKQEIISGTYMGDHANYSIRTTPQSLYDTTSDNIANIRVDGTRALYFSMGQYFYYTNDRGVTFHRVDCHSRIEFIYTNNTDAKKDVFIYTSGTQFLFDKITHTLKRILLPVAMSPAFSFTAGISAKTNSTMLYALHHDAAQKIDGEFGHTELWMSKNRGRNWQRMMNEAVTNEAAGIKPSFSMIACAELDADNAYLVTNRYEEKKEKGFVYWYGAFKTNDAGTNWNWVWKGGGGSGQYGIKDGKGVANLKDAWSEKAFGGEYIRLMDVGVYPKDGNVAIVTDWYRTMKTMDGGKTWNEIYSKEQSDGTYTSRGLDVTTSYGVHFDPFDSNHLAISYTDIGYHQSFNRGKSWERSVTGVPVEWINTCYWVVFDPLVKNKLWSAWSGMHDFPRGKMTRNPAWRKMAKGGICVSTDGGRSWQPSNEGMGFDSPTTCIVLDTTSPPGHRTLYASVYNKGVFKSTDDGKSWQLRNKGIEGNTCAFELTLTAAGTLFLTVPATPMHKDGKKGREFYSGAVYRSVDGADNWTKLTVTNTLLFPSGIGYDPAHPKRIYLGCWGDIDLSDLVGSEVARATGGNENLHMPGGIFLSEDDGDTWVSIFDPHQYVYDVTPDPVHPGRLYCNTFNQSAWRSDDAGKTWQQIKGYDFHWGQRAIVDQNDPEKIFLTTFGSSVWHGIPVTQ